MAVKDLAFEADARAGLLAGVEKLAAAVKPTLGPRGRNAILDKSISLLTSHCLLLPH